MEPSSTRTIKRDSKREDKPMSNDLPFWILKLQRMMKEVQLEKQERVKT